MGLLGAEEEVVGGEIAEGAEGDGAVEHGPEREEGDGGECPELVAAFSEKE